MSKRAVKAYCQKLLANLDKPAPCVVLIDRPKLPTFGEEQVLLVVEIFDSDEHNLTLTTGPIGKKVVHQVVLSWFWAAQDDQTGGARCDGLQESIDALFRQALKNIPIALSDPDSGVLSTLIYIGNDIVTRQNEPQTDESPDALVIFTGTKTIAVQEMLQG